METLWVVSLVNVEAVDAVTATRKKLSIAISSKYAYGCLLPLASSSYSTCDNHMYDVSCTLVMNCHIFTDSIAV